jgi:hypothetical protein
LAPHRTYSYSRKKSALGGLTSNSRSIPLEFAHRFDKKRNRKVSSEPARELQPLWPPGGAMVLTQRYLAFCLLFWFTASLTTYADDPISDREVDGMIQMSSSLRYEGRRSTLWNYVNTSLGLLTVDQIIRIAEAAPNTDAQVHFLVMYANGRGQHMKVEQVVRLSQAWPWATSHAQDAHASMIHKFVTQQAAQRLSVAQISRLVTEVPHTRPRVASSLLELIAKSQAENGRFSGEDLAAVAKLVSWTDPWTRDRINDLAAATKLKTLAAQRSGGEGQGCSGENGLGSLANSF